MSGSNCPAGFNAPQTHDLVTSNTDSKNVNPIFIVYGGGKAS